MVHNNLVCYCIVQSSVFINILSIAMNWSMFPHRVSVNWKPFDSL